MSLQAPKNVSCSTCASRDGSLFSHFNCGEIENLSNAKACSFYKKNQSVFLTGSTPRGVYCINKGKVKVFSLGEEGKEQIIHIASEGEVVGFRAMFSGEPFSVSAETLEESNICFIAKEDFLSMIDTSTTLRDAIMRELSKELSERAKFITQLAQKSVRERLAFSLVLLSDIYKDEPINLSREDLANFVGTATETLIRLLKQFKSEEVIEVMTRKIIVTDQNKLLSIAGR